MTWTWYYCRYDHMKMLCDRQPICSFCYSPLLPVEELESFKEDLKNVKERLQAVVTSLEGAHSGAREKAK